MTLLDGIKNQTYRVVSMDEPEHISRRLQALGLICGTPIMMLNKKRYGAVIVKVRGSRFAMGREIAKGIEIVEDTKKGREEDA